MACAVRGDSGRYQAGAPQPVGDLENLLERISRLGGPDGCALAGFDFPIGLPLAYARRCGIDDFLAALPQFGRGEWADFYRVAEHPDQIGLRRPFYPQRPGGARQADLFAGLGVVSIDELRRRCERSYPGRRAAAPLFWTMGAQQAGKAAIAGWRDVLAPALRRDGSSFAVWPFNGELAGLLRPGALVVAEAYPAEFYTHLGLAFPAARQLKAAMPDGKGAKRGGKRRQASRMANSKVLIDWAAAAGVALDAELRTAIETGFGPSNRGEDQFDAIIGLFGMLNVLLGRRPIYEPGDRIIRRIEGWILAQSQPLL
jgi:hypothetical protein